jgi:coproporphyrinogen III oxidase
MRQRVEEYITNLQDHIVSSLEKLDPDSPPFKRDSWMRAQGGSGRSCIFAGPPAEEAGVKSHQSVLEKGGR